MMKKYFYLATLIMLTTSCAQNKVGAITQPATVINTKNTAKVIAKLSEICDRNGLQIDNTGTHNVTCSQQSPVLAQGLLGTKYGTEVRSVVKFNAFPVGNSDTRVVGYVSMGNQTAFGQNNMMDMGPGGQMGAQVQRMLDQAKKEIEKK